MSELNDIDDLDDVAERTPLDNIIPDLGGLTWDDVPEEKPAVTVTLTESDKKLLDKYADLDVDDAKEDKEMNSLRRDRREFSEKLESDPNFRKKFIESEKERRAKITESSDDISNIIGRLQSGGLGVEDLEVSEDEVKNEIEDLPEVSETPEHAKKNKQGVYINNTGGHITINITIN
jgi:hypothetical protein